MGKCVVQGCPNKSYPECDFTNRPRKRFFSFPKDPGRVKVWLAALRETEHVPSEDHRICEDHFLKDHITQEGVSEDAIPIMPPYLDGSLAGGSGCEEMDDLSDPDEELGQTWDMEQDVSCALNARSSREAFPLNKAPGKPSKMSSRYEVSLNILTKRFMELLRSSPEGVLDLNEAARVLGTGKRRVYDITNVLGGIQLIRKRHKSKIQWIGCSSTSVLSCSMQQHKKEELLNLKAVEEELDELIKDCAHQLFALTDKKDNANCAYITSDDISRIKAFHEQVVISIRAPEETKLEVPAPHEDSIQIHLKSSRGPIKVLVYELGGDYSIDTFSSLEESKIHTTLLHTDLHSSFGAG